MAEVIAIDFDAIWDHVTKAFQCDLHSIHGPAHWKRVERNGLKIAAGNRAVVEVVKLFAVFHDSRREHDGSDFNHGERGAKFAANLRGALFDLSDADFDLLQFACREHTNGLLSQNPTVGACWDADRLDLTRIGLTPQAEFMSTELGRRLASQI